MGYLADKFLGRQAEVTLREQVDRELAKLGYQYDQHLNSEEWSSVYDEALKAGMQIERESDILPGNIYFRKEDSARYISEIAVLSRCGPHGEIQPTDTLTFFKTQAEPVDFMFPSVEPLVADKIAEYTVAEFLVAYQSARPTFAANLAAKAILELKSWVS